MAYMSQETKKQIAEKLKAALAGSGLKYTLAVRHHSKLVMNISAGPVDFIGERVREFWPVREDVPTYLDVNPYHWQDVFSGRSRELFGIIFPILNDGNWDKSEPMTDYFNVGWYVEVNVGQWNKPYVLTAPAAAMAH